MYSLETIWNSMYSLKTIWSSMYCLGLGDYLEFHVLLGDYLEFHVLLGDYLFQTIWMTPVASARGGLADPDSEPLIWTAGLD